MSIATRLRYLLARSATKAAGLSFVPTWVRASWLEPSFERLTREGYAANAAVFACVSTLALSYIEPPLIAVDRKTDEKLGSGDPLQRLLDRPNPAMGGRALALYRMVYKSVGGNAYQHKVRNRPRTGQVVEMWPYHAGSLSPVPSAMSWIAEYEYDPGDGDKQRVPAEDVVHFRWPAIDLSQPWMAMPPLRAVAREVDTDNEATRYLYALLFNDAMPRTALMLPPEANLNDGQFERLRQQFVARHGGMNRGGVTVIEGGAKIDRLGLDLEQLAFDALRRVPESRIAGAFRTPAIVAQLTAGLDSGTYANFKEARQAFTEETLVPMWEMDAEELDQELAAEFGDRYRIRYDLDKVRALQEDRHQVWADTILAYEKGLLTKNEGRRKIGLDDVPDGDGFATAPQTAQLQPEILELPPRKRMQRKASPELEQRLEAALRTYLSRQYGTAAAGQTMDDGAEVERLLREFYPELLALAIAQAAADLGEIYQVDAALIREQVDELGTLVRSVAETTRAEVRALSTLAAAEGWGNERLAQELRQLAEIRSPERALLIARTELASATSRGSLLAYRASGQVERVEWLLGPEPCAVCVELRAQTPSVELGETFHGGLMHPPAHPRCTCALAPVIGGR